MIIDVKSSSDDALLDQEENAIQIISLWQGLSDLIRAEAILANNDMHQSYTTSVAILAELERRYQAEQEDIALCQLEG